MDQGWSTIIVVECEKDQPYKISGWSDLSVFLLCRWPLKYGKSYTAAVCGLSQFYYKKVKTEQLMRLFISALDEAEIPYRLEINNALSGQSDNILQLDGTDSAILLQGK